MTYKKQPRVGMTEQERWENVVRYAKELLELCDVPVGDEEEDDRAPLCVMEYRVKRVQLEVGGPTTYIEFWFSGDVCTSETVMWASLYTNRFGSGKDMQEFPYLDNEVPALFNKYQLYLMDY
jgi:hypothetical protein